MALPFKEALIYITCKRYPDDIIRFMFMINVQAKYFPFVSAGFNLLSGASIWNELIGIGVGHLYVYLKDVYPHKHGGKDYLRTPNWM